jgi:hypothetical protein
VQTYLLQQISENDGKDCGCVTQYSIFQQSRKTKDSADKVASDSRKQGAIRIMLPLRGWLGRSVLSLAVATPVTLAALVAGIAAASAASASGSAATTASATAGAAATGAAAAAAAAATERAWSPVVVDDVVPLGAQVSPELTNVSRDGGHSVLLNRRIVWLYADTECIGDDGARLSFASNTAAYAAQPRADIAAVRDFGLVAVGRNAFGDAENAVLAPDAVDGGGWVPFGADERRYNELNQGKRRIAICTCFHFSHIYLYSWGGEDLSRTSSCAWLAILDLTKEELSLPEKRRTGAGVRLENPT